MWNWNYESEEKSPPQARTPQEGHTPVKHNPESRRDKMGQVAIIGQSIQIKGELTGNEDLTIDGTVEGNIQLKENNLTIGPNGNIKADINAKKVTIIGEVQGNVTAEETVEIRESGKLRGNITAPRLVIADGAFFKGSVEMERKPGQVKEKSLRDEKSALRPELLAVKP
jgi:cytoskeletal protein CcmA (bactofilin family)